MSRVISIVNQKGGVGKTTTAVNLGACLSLSEKRVLLVDLDPQSNTTRALGYMSDPERPSVYDALMDGVPFRDITLPTDVDRLTLVPSEPDLAGFEVEALSREQREYSLRRLVQEAADGFDFVLVDCPPSLGILTVNGLAAADGVLIPVQCEYLALEGVTLLLGTLERIRLAVNPALEIHGVLLTMFDERTNLSRQVVDDIRSFFGEKAYSAVIPRSVRLSEAPSFGKPIFLYDPKSKGAEAYFALAKEVLEREASLMAGLVSPEAVASSEQQTPSAAAVSETGSPSLTEPGTAPDAGTDTVDQAVSGAQSSSDSTQVVEAITAPEQSFDELLVSALGQQVAVDPPV